MNRLKGEKAFITGASKGIGRGIAEAFVKEGAEVIIADIDFVEAEKTAKEINATAAKCDVSDEKQVEAALKNKGVTILVNNAGIFPFKQFGDSDYDAVWEKTMNVNLKGVKNCCKHALASGKLKKIINISSIAAVQGYSGLTHYCATKAAVLGFTRALALELASKKINVNAVCPGLIDTPGVHVSMNDEGIKEYAKNIPLQRAGKPEDIGWACVFLASKESNFMTGQEIIIDGGSSIQ
ncbi:SDR family oxidoreductase [Candidatus Micrarchaeota archaeon]|nr:SDR family oxidoreductase [Candidatus Micrarchaeota archaeon]